MTVRNGRPVPQHPGRSWCARGLLLGGLLLCGCDRSGPASRPAADAFPVEQLGRFNQASAHVAMDQFNEALARLGELDGAAADDPAALANRAAALTGLQRFVEAEPLARRAFEQGGGRPDIALILAAAIEGQDRREEAVELLRQTVAAHAREVGARWALLAALRDEGDAALRGEMLTLAEELLRLAPRNVAALLEAALTAAQLGRVQRAGEMLERLLAVIHEPPPGGAEPLQRAREALAAGDGAAAAFGITVLRNLVRNTDRYRADVVALGPTLTETPLPLIHPHRALSAAPQQAVRAEVRFEDATAALGLDAVLDDQSVRDVAAGVEGEGRSPALYFTRRDRAGVLMLLREGRYVDATVSAGLADAPPAVAALFFDVNNDRRQDLVLATRDGVQVWLAGEDGVFRVAEQPGLRDATGTRGLLPFDFDNDGDLDLLRWTDATLLAHRNDGEGGFGPGMALPGLPAELRRVENVRAFDLDDDGDIDLVVSRRTGSAVVELSVFSNERLGRFRDVTGQIGPERLTFSFDPPVADFSNDGWLEIPGLRGGSLRFGPEFEFSDTRRDDRGVPHPLAQAVLDIDRDGQLDLVSISSDGDTGIAGVRVTPPARLIAIDLDGDGAVDLLSARGQAFLNRTRNAGNWLTVALAAQIEGDSRFNAFGIGSVIELRAGPLYQKRVATDALTHFGLGPYAHADVLRVTWPNGSYQNIRFRVTDAVQLAGNQQIVQEQTLKGSCPYLYAWNGERFEFITDVLWRSALGMAIMADVFMHHHTADDYFLIRAEQLRPRDGFFELRFAEELWETAYFDYARLLVVDHPPGTEVYVDERCVAPPYPEPRVYLVRERRPVAQATLVTAAGRRDVTGLLERSDRRVVEGFAATRYQGIVEDQELILDLGSLERDGEPLLLFLRGWLMPTDASLNVAISQNPALAARPPELHVEQPDGSWAPAIASLGFPSGKDKTLVVDLSPHVGPGRSRVMLRTNFAIYWDEAFVAAGAHASASVAIAPQPRSRDEARAAPIVPAGVPLVITELPVARAELRFRGSSREHRVALHGPAVTDYDAVDPEHRWRPLVGTYTRYSDVTELLLAADSMYAIVGAGDEVALEFDASGLPSLPAGWRRDYVIHTDGWLKDGDLNSATGKTVAPLPFHGMSSYPYPDSEHYPDTPAHRDYLRRYHTREVDAGVYREALRGRE